MCSEYYPFHREKHCRILFICEGFSFFFEVLGCLNILYKPIQFTKKIKKKKNPTTQRTQQTQNKTK